VLSVANCYQIAEKYTDVKIEWHYSNVQIAGNIVPTLPRLYMKGEPFIAGGYPISISEAPYQVRINPCCDSFFGRGIIYHRSESK